MELGSNTCPDWEENKLGDVITKFIGGGTPSRSITTYWGGGIPWVTVKDFASFNPTKTQETITEEGIDNSATHLIPKGTVITSTRMALGKAVIYEVDVCINQDLKALISGKYIDNLYLYYWFQKHECQIEVLGSGSTVKGISIPDLKNIPFLKPPLNEQRAIATALSDVDGLLAALDKLIAKKQAIKQAAMQELLSGKRRLPGFHDEWTSYKLFELGQFYKGSGIRRDEVVDDGLGCIRYGEIYTRFDNYFENPVSHIPDSVAQTAFPIKTGDLLFTGSGETAEEIGKCVAYLGCAKTYAGGDIVVLRPNGQNPTYLGHLMNHDSVVEQKKSLGQGDAVVHISAANLGKIELQLPPRDEQDAIVEIILSMDTEISALEQRRNKTLAIKQGMMQELLTGRTRLIDNTKEAA